ncbi:MAG: hypothetical protein B6D61_01120 [Bacteroidetes bacterium 4484_249]|nr:MAG: hypothetical protein B6D61_01120 [Bacteroidetes bacterium 4484_249]
MRKFNTSGPNIPLKHYTLERIGLIRKGIELVKDNRYFTIWAPRQTGKSTYFRQLAKVLEKQDYKVAHINFENYINAPTETFLERFVGEINKYWDTGFQITNISKIFYEIEAQKNQKCVLIIDEVEGINSEYFGEFLHSIRNAYHSRENHCLKSVILVGVSNIVGVVQDNASPFNISDNLNIPYFTVEEVLELLLQHETETGQLFEDKVKKKIYEITAGQPGLVNGFAYKLVENYPDNKTLTYDDYLNVEKWYLNEAIDKNFSNILNKAREERSFVERLLFTEDKIPFKIDRPSIKLLHTNGLIKKDDNDNVTFWVPFYKKRLYDAFYPYSNGETATILRNIIIQDLFTADNKLKLNKLIESYKEYVKRRGFNVFREKDENGKYKSIKEAALIYSFETYIQAFLQMVNAKSYREANTGLGRSDLIINLNGAEYLFETKIYYYERRFLEGKEQLAYYCNSLGLNEGIYLVFIPNNVYKPENVADNKEVINNVTISTFLIHYDDEKWV